jgi:hypothetical protein
VFRHSRQQRCDKRDFVKDANSYEVIFSCVLRKAMDGGEEKRIVRNIREYPSRLIVCFDQHSKRIEKYYGPKDRILPLLEEEDLSQAQIKKLVEKRTWFNKKWIWVDLSKGKFLLNSR